MPIKTVIFDLGKVIVPFDFHLGYEALRPHCRLSPEEMARAIRATGVVTHLEMGQISPRDFVTRISEALDLTVDYDHFCELWGSIFLPEPLVPESLITALRDRYRVLALSNTNAIHFETITQRYPILSHFDGFVLSFEVGAMKPDPKIYEVAIERAACRPEECFFTDDVASYVEAARNAGMQAVQFESVPKLEQDLKAHGIVWS